MPKSTLAGHPRHPMLIVAPAALIPFGFILDVLARSTDNDDYANAAYYSLTGGLIGGLAANVAMRRKEYKHGGSGATLAMGAIAALGVLVSGWFGGKMV